jgi:hypothetical protein
MRRPEITPNMGLHPRARFSIKLKDTAFLLSGAGTGGERESYEHIVELYVRIAEELETMLDG